MSMHPKNHTIMTHGCPIAEATSLSSATEPAGEVPDLQQIEQPSTSQRHTNRQRQHRHRADPGNIFRPAHERRFPVRLTNLTQSVTRSDVARFFTNFNVTENDVRCGVLLLFSMIQLHQATAAVIAPMYACSQAEVTMTVFIRMAGQSLTHKRWRPVHGGSCFTGMRTAGMRQCCRDASWCDTHTQIPLLSYP